MHKRFLIPIIVLAFLLAACGGKTPTQVADTEDSVQEAVPTPEATHTQPPPTETSVPTAEEESAAVELVSECTLVSSPLNPESPYADLFRVTEDDWVSGPDTAALTIVEYGDFQ